MSLFDDNYEQARAAGAPLAEVVRARRLEDIVGQDHLVGEKGAIRAMVASKRLHSMILWGPPGVGKTTMARLIAKEAGYAMVGISAAGGSVRDVVAAVEGARTRLGQTGQRTVVFIDEVHRFNKSQQDILLGSVESGDIVLIGATTENPYFEVNAALMSRTTLWRLKALDARAIAELIDRGVVARGVEVLDEAREALIGVADGDGRAALSTLDVAISISGGGAVDIESVRAARDGRLVHQGADSHYDQVSAMIKAIRGSDVDAGLYWMSALLAGGESPRFVARRLLILSAEDVGLAEPMALVIAEAGQRAVEMLGMPEARLVLGEMVVMLATAPKSNSVTVAVGRAESELARGVGAVPVALRDAHYSGGQKMGHGASYLYPHEYGGWVEQNYLPEGVEVLFFEAGSGGSEPERVRRWLKATKRAQQAEDQ